MTTSSQPESSVPSAWLSLLLLCLSEITWMCWMAVQPTVESSAPTSSNN